MLQVSRQEGGHVSVKLKNSSSSEQMFDNMINNPPPEDEVEEINEEDVIEIIEDDTEEGGNGLPEGMEEMGLTPLDGEEGFEGMEGEDESIEIEDDAKMSFKKHEGSVFCVAINPAESGMAVSGGEDDKAYLWKTEDASIIKELPGHKDSVTLVEFSKNGKYVATADMGGLVQVWTVSDCLLAWSFECSDIEWLHWHPAALVLFAGTIDGDIYMWKIPSGDCKIMPGNGQKTTAGCVLPNGKQVFAGYANGSLVLWELRTATQVFSLKDDQSHEDSVNCVASSLNSALLVSGSYDSQIKITNAATGKILSTFDAGFPQGDDGSEDSSVECVAFTDDTSYILSGSLSGVLAVWDISAQRLRHTCKHPLGAGIATLCFDPTVSYHIFTGALDGVVRLWDIRSGECVNQWCGHTDAILDLKISKDGKKLITASDDGSAKVFEV